jgi:hypothetical protein
MIEWGADFITRLDRAVRWSSPNAATRAEIAPENSDPACSDTRPRLRQDGTFPAAGFGCSAGAAPGPRLDAAPRTWYNPRSATRSTAMSDDLKYQLRLTLNDGFAQVARKAPGDPRIAPLAEILKRHDAALKCQHDAFAGYVAEAEAKGVENYPLYEWTKATVDDPVKEAKYIKSFTLYVGGDEVYDKDSADALEADLQPLVGGPIVAKMFKYDSDPAHNPQPPRKNA